MNFNDAFLYAMKSECGPDFNPEDLATIDGDISTPTNRKKCGYVNNPKDPGGETKFGIASKAYPHVDIKSLNMQEAKDIYERDFWKGCGCDVLQDPIALQVFDASLNNGPGNASRFLQRALGVADDGHIGPITRKVLATAEPHILAIKFDAERLLFFTKLSTWPTFGAGWANRIAFNLEVVSKSCNSELASLLMQASVNIKSNTKSATWSTKGIGICRAWVTKLQGVK
jgi:lysozyme family protein